jgi:hypothetical protein
MEDLNIKYDLTVDDIHKIRELNYERRKNMTIEEYNADIEKGAEISRKRIEELRKKKKSA